MSNSGSFCNRPLSTTFDAREENSGYRWTGCSKWDKNGPFRRLRGPFSSGYRNGFLCAYEPVDSNSPTL
ncbi:hypothetical protein K438DRAFT_1863753 [Mycena galopus ATCC 62051]|nr:hypothetical protein K438DRAFT_1863753 [Mycena galopus ATCC 62051]